MRNPSHPKSVRGRTIQTIRQPTTLLLRNSLARIARTLVRTLRQPLETSLMLTRPSKLHSLARIVPPQRVLTMPRLKVSTKTPTPKEARKTKRQMPKMKPPKRETTKRPKTRTSKTKTSNQKTVAFLKTATNQRAKLRAMAETEKRQRMWTSKTRKVAGQKEISGPKA